MGGGGSGEGRGVVGKRRGANQGGAGEIQPCQDSVLRPASGCRASRETRWERDSDEP